MHIINATLRKTPGLHTVSWENGVITAVTPQAGNLHPATQDLDANGQLVIAPLVEPHIHLDATLTAGEPEWNMSGTLFEGIERWAQRKETITHEDTKLRHYQRYNADVDRWVALAKDSDARDNVYPVPLEMMP